MCVGFVDSTWPDWPVSFEASVDSDCVKLADFDDDKLDIITSYAGFTMFHPKEMLTVPVINQKQHSPYPWNECEISEPDYIKEVLI